MAGDEDDCLIDPAALARAEAALARLGHDYLRWVERDLDAARACLISTPPDHHTLYRLAHDIKGQAGTFGYPLIGAIAQRLCQILAAGGGADPVSRHLDAMAEAVARRLHGDDGDAARELLARLD